VIWANEIPAEDATRADGVYEYVCDEEGGAVGKELLAEFHGDAVAGGEGDDEGGVFPAWECPVVGRVREAAGEREVGHEVSPVGGVDWERENIFVVPTTDFCWKRTNTTYEPQCRRF